MIPPLSPEYWSKVTQSFGVPNELYESKTHNGTDFACPIGTPVYAPCDGEIIKRYVNHKTMGNCVYFSDLNGNYMRFLHLSETQPRGSYKQGQIIGKTGDTGLSFGAHLHVDVWKCAINVALIKTRDGVFKYLYDPIVFFNNN